MKSRISFSPTLIAAAACLALTACGGGGGQPQMSAASADEAAGVQAALSAISTTTADGREITLTRVTETRVSRTVFEYLYHIKIKNNETAINNAIATLTNVGAGSEIISGVVRVGTLEADATVAPFGTITIRHDRAVPFDTDAMVWSVVNSTANVNTATLPPGMSANATKIANDPQIAALIADQSTPEAAKARWHQFLELVRIASPSRFEYRMVAEIHRRMFEEWGFSPSEVKTRADGFLPGTDVNIVDGQPVYNACVEIKGSYSSTPLALHYKGEYPKVLLEGHIDVVNPEVLPPDEDPYNRIKLQPYSQAVVETPAQLAAIPLELNFGPDARVLEDANYEVASRWFASTNAASSGGGVRIYVPGYGDMMASASNGLALAAAMKKHNIKPVYDVWICGTAGEEGKGNLAGMKQLFGFEQDLGTGSNPLNFVASYGLEGGGNLNFIGSYRFEMKYNAPASPGPNRPSAAEALASSIARIADVKTPSELRPNTPRTTYTVGRSWCDEVPEGSDVVPSCSIEVDMRSTREEVLNEIREVIEPMFQAGVSAENARYGYADGSPEAVTIELMWYGLRPAFVLLSPNNPAIHAGFASNAATGGSSSTTVGTGSGSLNDNVPANTGVPTNNFTIRSVVGGGGGHAFWEWGTRGNPATEVSQMRRVLTAVLLTSGFHAADGTIVPPAATPLGRRNREVIR